MSAWYSSWLPGLPALNFAIPSSLQGRFISFLLKKLLGHFLKPGQLDVGQIESQIGSGFVQVNDLELDHEAINSFFTGLPLALRDGYISSVTARVPLPNPLTSNLGLSLDALHLTFHVVSDPAAPAETGLSESVASVADSFVHDELTKQENTALWESAHTEIVGDEGDGAIPGGLVPFLSNREDEASQNEHDTVGVSLFSTLMDKLLDIFEFTAVDTKITIIHEGNMSLTISIPQIRYGTETKCNLGEPNSSPQGADWRTLTVSGVTITTQDLRSPTKAPLPGSQGSRSPLTPSSPVLSLSAPQVDLHPASPATSSSSLDVETQALMSQSLVALPARPVSPVESASSSLYQSALSEGRDLASLENPDLQDNDVAANMVDVGQSVSMTKEINKEDTSEDVLLSIGPVPTTIRLQTRSPHESNQDESSSSHNGLTKVSVALGVVASAVHARQLAGILEMVDFFAMRATRNPPSHTTGEPKVATTARPHPWMLDISLKGLVILVLPVKFEPQMASDLTAFFADPSKPPHLTSNYLRLYAEEIGLTATSGGISQNAPCDGGKTGYNTSAIYELTCADIKACVHSYSSSPAEMSTLCPVLFVDSRLTDQYVVPSFRPAGNAMDVLLPTFNINDQSTRDSVTDAPLRQVAPPLETTRNYSSESGAAPFTTSTENKKLPAVLIRMESVGDIGRGTRAPALKNEISITILPIHILLDIQELVDNPDAISFLKELTRGTGDVSEGQISNADVEGDIASSDEERGDPPPATAEIRSLAEREKERRRLERLVMEDLGLSVNLSANDPEPAQVRTPRTKGHVKGRTQTSLILLFSMIRVTLRCSPLPGQPPRSGTLVTDFHNLELGYGKYSEDEHPRFTSAAIHSGLHPPDTDAQFCVKFRAILVALRPTGVPIASTVAVVTSLGDSNDPGTIDNTDPTRAPLKPQIRVSNAVHSNDTVLATVLDVYIPSVYLNLTKGALDGLLFLVDDATQTVERAMNQQVANRPDESYETRKDRAQDLPAKGKILTIRTSVTEVVASLMVPRPEGGHLQDRPLDISASDIAVLLEMKPENEEQTALNVEVMELSVMNMTSSETFQTILSRTSPRNMSSPSKAALKFSFASSTVPNSVAKATRLTSTLWGFTGNMFSDTQWLTDLSTFAKSPPGVFESVIPNERTSVSLKVQESSLCVLPPTHPGALVLYLGDLEFTTEMVGSAAESTFRLLAPNLSFLSTDDISSCADIAIAHNRSGVSYWRSCGYALIAEATESGLSLSNSHGEVPTTRVEVEKVNLRLHLCADTLTPISSIISDWQHLATATEETPVQRTVPTMVSELYSPSTSLTSSVDEFAFRRLPEIGPAPDMINDDLPSNLDYLDESFSAAAGLREFCDEDLDDFRNDGDFEVDLTSSTAEQGVTGIISRVGGETVKMMQPEGIQVIEGYFESLPSDTSGESPSIGDTSLSVRVHDCSLTLFLYDGYDWLKTRKTIEEEVKDIRRRLAKLRQLVASGQTPDASIEEMSSVLFNSVYVGLDQDVEGLEPGALIAAIDEQLNDDVETASQSSWQSLRPHASGRPKQKSIRVHGKRLTRSKSPCMEFVFTNAKAEIDFYRPSDGLSSRTFLIVRDVEILDHIKTSTWKKFLTALQLDSRGNTRETESNMVQVELRTVRPVPGHPSEEVRLRAKILPLRLYVDQDAVDFLKKFFSFKEPNVNQNVATPSNNDAFIQFAEIFPVMLKLDYKPRRVDYKALREGRTIELMNFFHFDGAEMTLRHITLAGITGWPRLFELLNDLWTPDVKATQLVDVISGVAPIRSVVNVGSGVADLVLLPIAQYKKDGRVLRGLQKGTTAFFKSTALEAIKLGAKLATGTQVILEQAEGILGGQFQQPVTTETIPEDATLLASDASDDESDSDVISKYAEQPVDIKEGVHSAYKSLRKNFGSAAQTILAVPMEVYERSGDEGAIRSVIRAVPIAVLKPMIGATEAVSKTLLGLHNTLDSNVRHDNEAKYKHRS